MIKAVKAIASLVAASALCIGLASSMAPASANTATARQATPWISGGAIYHKGGPDPYRCSTAALGAYQGQWALLTAAHCVGFKDGTPIFAKLDGVNLTEIGYSAKVVTERDQAFVILNSRFQSQMSSRFFRVFTNEHGRTAPVAPGYSISKSGERWYKSGSTSGWTTSTATEVGEWHKFPGGRIVQSHYQVTSCDFGKPGDSGSGLFKLLNGRYHLLGVLSSINLSDCTAQATESKTVIQNGFAPFRAP